MTAPITAEPTPSPSPSPTPSPTPSPSPTATPIPWSAGDQAGQAAATLGEVGKGASTVLIWLVILILPVALAILVLLFVLAGAARLADPFRKRLLPFTVARPVTFTQPAWPVQGQPAPVVPANPTVTPPKP